MVGPHDLAVLTIYKFNNGLRGIIGGELPESGVGTEVFRVGELRISRQGLFLQHWSGFPSFLQGAGEHACAAITLSISIIAERGYTGAGNQSFLRYCHCDVFQ